MAVGQFSTPSGCACFPDDRVQDLCVQHVINAEPLDGDMEMITVFRPELTGCIS